MSDAPISIIEQAAKRLAELKRAGIDAPDADAATLVAAAAGRSCHAFARTRDEPLRTRRSGPVLRPDARHRPRARRIAGGRAGDLPTPLAEVEPPRAPVSSIGRARSREVEIDLARLEEAGYVVAANASSRIAEEFRIIKRPIVMNIQAAGKEMPRANMVMVTSSVPGEGKTFTAVNLALSIAMEMDKRVLLVDADVAQPSIPLRLGLSRPARDCSICCPIPRWRCPTACSAPNIEKFTILPAGTPHARSTELLASEAMSRLVAELTNRYPDRVVIFDTPPLLASSESRVLATYLGQILFVVEADRTAQAKISEALSTIESCPVVMTVLNKARRTADAPYGYRH